MGGIGEAVSRVEVWTCWDLGGRFQCEAAGRPYTRPFSSLKVKVMLLYLLSSVQVLLIHTRCTGWFRKGS